MAENSKIEWTDHTWNPWIGCTKVSPACDFCYAEDMMDHRYGRVQWGAGQDRSRTAAGTWKLPLQLERKAAAAGKIETVFCLSLGDIWDNEVDPRWRSDAFDIMDQTPHLIYLLLSKRIGNAVKMCDPAAGERLLPRNAALGATMVTQAEYDRDRIKLKEAAEVLGAMFTFGSFEPMLGPVILDKNAPDWIICGGESGRNARDMPEGWARDLRDGSARFNRAFFMKQMTSKKPIPDDLFVRQFPPSLSLPLKDQQ
jgi:protein gp37